MILSSPTSSLTAICGLWGIRIPCSAIDTMGSIGALSSETGLKSHFAFSRLSTGDEPPHQILSYTLLFSLFLHFPYIADPPLRTSAPTWPRSRLHVIVLAPSDRSRLFDGHMTYDSHVFTSILSVSNVPPPAVRPITRSRTARSSTFYSFAICSHSCLPFVFNLAVFTFRQGTSSPKP